jgi:hypothetical protein
MKIQNSLHLCLMRLQPLQLQEVFDRLVQDQFPSISRQRQRPHHNCFHRHHRQQQLSIQLTAFFEQAIHLAEQLA